MLYWWAILELPAGSENDYRLTWKTYKWISLDKLPKINSLDECLNQLEYSQEYWRMLCTLYAWMCMFINNSRSFIPPKLRKELVKERVRINFNIKEWWYLIDWVKCVIDWLEDWIMYRIHKSEVKALLDKNYIVNIGMYVWGDFDLVSKDWQVTEDEIDKVKNAKLGHSICLKRQLKAGVLLDNYEWIKPNNKIKIDDIDKFINSWFVYDWAYLIVPNVVIEKIFKQALKWVWYKEATEYAMKIEKELYPREKKLFQRVMQLKYIWKTIKEPL